VNPADLVNWFVERFDLRSPQKQFSTTIEYTDLISGKASGTFKETQKNKPSPSSPLRFSEVRSEMTFPRDWSVRTCYVGWTNSMEPTLDYGDAPFIMPFAKWKTLTDGNLEGEIAIYRYGDLRIIHRCIGKDTRGRWIFKGDNNFLPDAPVEESQVEDVVIGIMFTNDKLREGQD
jgi:hypothetical protein